MFLKNGCVHARTQDCSIETATAATRAGRTHIIQWVWEPAPELTAQHIKAVTRSMTKLQRHPSQPEPIPAIPTTPCRASSPHQTLKQHRPGP